MQWQVVAKEAEAEAELQKNIGPNLNLKEEE
jgi:hypothetical protein